MGRVEEVDPPTGSGSVLSPIGGRSATVHLGAAERQGRPNSDCSARLVMSVAPVVTALRNNSPCKKCCQGCSGKI